MTINAITLGTGGDTAPVFKLMDSSGLAPLDLPPELAGASRQGEWAAPLPPPSQDAIAQFRSAMGESPQVRRQSPVAMAYGAVAANMAPQQPTQPAPMATAPTSSVPLPTAEPVAAPQYGGSARPETPREPIPVAQQPQVPVTPDALAAAVQPKPAVPSAAPAPRTEVVAQTQQPQVPVTPNAPASAEQPKPMAPSAAPAPASETAAQTQQPQAPTVKAVIQTAETPVPTAPAAEQPNPMTPSVTPEAETVAQAQQPASAQQPIQASQKAQPNDEDDVSAITLQALPVAMPAAAAPDVASAAIAPSVSLEIDPAAATARTHELVEAASQVADTILVTPSLVSGEGEVTIRLMPTVLDGSEIRLEAKGSSISVTVTPTTQSVAQAVEQSRIQFEQQLTERLPSFQFAIAVEGVRGTGRKRGIEA